MAKGEIEMHLPAVTVCFYCHTHASAESTPGQFDIRQAGQLGNGARASPGVIMGTDTNRSPCLGLRYLRHTEAAR
ncbi:hypothetical protein P154DRAFT_137204 [Amniculicola lignicola CBS 123094]|uniref:Uncharacterized protein n=1 Tax=Amniculicola lignicola CBS 123094 TaxID=1392246 RepID=A0A6A5WLY8_9PLEO|nr:hypothetical protein P154DRAFT_137204 [Amniculicola lignicola CBS 123094]